MIIWHSCEIDPPSKDGDYLVFYKMTNRPGYSFDRNRYNVKEKTWDFNEDTHYVKLIKWAEIELPCY